MTEKRFTIKEIDNFSYGIEVTDVIMDNNIELPQSTACDLLNELWKENEQLKSFKEQNINEYLKLKEVCNECKKENKQLKKEVKSLKNDLCFCNFLDCITGTEDITEMKKENEQLKEAYLRLCEICEENGISIPTS